MPKQPTIPFPKGQASTPAAKPVAPPRAEQPAEDVFEEDFTDVQSGFPMAEEGSHHAKVIDFESSDSRSGNPQYVWQFRITAGASRGIELRYWTSLLPQARWKAAETLTALGIQAAGSIVRFRKADVLGKPCIIEVIHDTFEGRLNHKVARVHAPNQQSIEAARTDAEEVPY